MKTQVSETDAQQLCFMLIIIGTYSPGMYKCRFAVVEPGNVLKSRAFLTEVDISLFFKAVGDILGSLSR